MDGILQLIGSAGGPTSFVGLMLLIYFMVRKQEATVRAEQLATIERTRSEVLELDAAKDKAEAIVVDLRKQLHEKDIEITRLKVRLLTAGLEVENGD